MGGKNPSKKRHHPTPQKKGTKQAGLAKLTAHYSTMTLFSFEDTIVHGQVFLLLIRCIRAVICPAEWNLVSTFFFFFFCPAQTCSKNTVVGMLTLLSVAESNCSQIPRAVKLNPFCCFCQSESDIFTSMSDWD